MGWDLDEKCYDTLSSSFLCICVDFQYSGSHFGFFIILNHFPKNNVSHLILLPFYDLITVFKCEKHPEDLVNLNNIHYFEE